MARPTEQKAEYFPHYVGGGKTLRALERTYGNDGYAFWFKLLETLCCTDGQCLNLLSDIERIDFSGYVMQTEENVLEIINLLVRLGQVDRELWEHNRRVWVQGLVDNLAPMYSKRSGGTPQKPDVEPVSVTETPMIPRFRDGNPDDTAFPRQSVTETPQSRVEYSREEKSIGEKNTLTDSGATAPDVDVKSPNAPTLRDVWFEEFWSAYPKKAGKIAARKAWDKVKPDADMHRRMLEAVALAAKSDQWRRDRGQYIPNPATWLNRGQWDDGPMNAQTAPQPALSKAEQFRELARRYKENGE